MQRSACSRNVFTCSVGRLSSAESRRARIIKAQVMAVEYPLNCCSRLAKFWIAGAALLLSGRIAVLVKNDDSMRTCRAVLRASFVVTLRRSLDSAWLLGCHALARPWLCPGDDARGPLRGRNATARSPVPTHCLIHLAAVTDCRSFVRQCVRGHSL